jgi:hypothetical protein
MELEMPEINETSPESELTPLEQLIASNKERARALVLRKCTPQINFQLKYLELLLEHLVGDDLETVKWKFNEYISDSLTKGEKTADESERKQKEAENLAILSGRRATPPGTVPLLGRGQSHRK